MCNDATEMRENECAVIMHKNTHTQTHTCTHPCMMLIHTRRKELTTKLIRLKFYFSRFALSHGSGNSLQWQQRGKTLIYTLNRLHQQHCELHTMTHTKNVHLICSFFFSPIPLFYALWPTPFELIRYMRIRHLSLSLSFNRTFCTFIAINTHAFIFMPGSCLTFIRTYEFYIFQLKKQ